MLCYMGSRSERVDLQARLALWLPTVQSKLLLPHRKGSNELRSCKCLTCELLSSLPSAHRPFPLRRMFLFRRCPTEHSGTCQVLPAAGTESPLLQGWGLEGSKPAQHVPFQRRTYSPVDSHPSQPFLQSQHTAQGLLLETEIIFSSFAFQGPEVKKHHPQPPQRAPLASCGTSRKSCTLKLGTSRPNTKPLDVSPTHLQ